MHELADRAGFRPMLPFNGEARSSTCNYCALLSKLAVDIEAPLVQLFQLRIITMVQLTLEDPKVVGQYKFGHYSVPS